MKKYIILLLIFSLAAALTIYAGKKKKKNTQFSYTALGETFQCNANNDTSWNCHLPQDNPRSQHTTLHLWKITKKEQNKQAPDPAHPGKQTTLHGDELTIAQTRKTLTETFTNLFGEPVKETMFFCPQEKTMAGYAIALSSTLEINDRGNIREVKIPLPSAEFFYKITPEKAVFITNQFNRTPDMLEKDLRAITRQELHSLYNEQISSQLCNLPL